MKKIVLSSRGFTLTELIVAMVMFSIFSIFIGTLMGYTFENWAKHRAEYELT
jgi:prepilin-type N-terminal cleavage/methylation domain-containing protein